MSEVSVNPATILTEQERNRLFALLNLFSAIWESGKHNFGFEVHTIHKENLVEIRISYIGFNYHDESWDCWEYVRAEKITENEFCQGEKQTNRTAFEEPFDCLKGIAGHCSVWETTCGREIRKAAYVDQIIDFSGFYRFTVVKGNNRT